MTGAQATRTHRGPRHGPRPGVCHQEHRRPPRAAARTAARTTPRRPRPDPPSARRGAGPGPRDQRTGQADAPALAAGQAASALAEDAVRRPGRPARRLTRAARTTSSGAAGVARRTFSATVPANRYGPCGTQATLARQASASRWPYGRDPVDGPHGTPALTIGSQQTQDHRQERALAGTRWAR